jgi:hypothetical protein
MAIWSPEFYTPKSDEPHSMIPQSDLVRFNRFHIEEETEKKIREATRDIFDEEMFRKMFKTVKEIKNGVQQVGQ